MVVLLLSLQNNMAWQGKARPGMVSQGEEMAWQGMAWLGEAWRGMARQGDGEARRRFVINFGCLTMQERDMEHEFDTYEPLDVTRLFKGQRIGVADCEMMTGMSCQDKDYDLAMLRLRDRIQKAADEASHIIAIRREGDGLLIMTDEEASEYFEKEMAKMRKRARRYLESMGTRVDMSQLTTQRQHQHIRTIALETQRQLAGSRAVRKIIAAEKAKQITQGEAGPG